METQTEIDKEIDKEINRERQKETDTKTERKKGRQTDGQTDRHRYQTAFTLNFCIKGNILTHCFYCPFAHFSFILYFVKSVYSDMPW